MARKKLGEFLIELGLLDEASLRSALTEQRRWGGPLGKILVQMRLIEEQKLISALSRLLTVPIIDVDKLEIPANVLALIPADLAEKHSVIPFRLQGKFLDVAMADPTNLGIIDEMRIRTQLNLRPHITGPKVMERALGKFYSRGFAQYSAAELTSPGGDFEIEVESGSSLVKPEIDPTLRPFPRSKTPTSNPQPVAPLVSKERLEIEALQTRVTHLESLVARDEDVLRKVLSLLIDKGLATPEEIVERIS